MQLLYRQEYNGREYSVDAIIFMTEGGIWEPIIVESQIEKDYLMGLCLMLGRNYEVLLDGVDERKLDLPPTFVRIPHLPD